MEYKVSDKLFDVYAEILHDHGEEALEILELIDELQNRINDLYLGEEWW